MIFLAGNSLLLLSGLIEKDAFYTGLPFVCVLASLSVYVVPQKTIRQSVPIVAALTVCAYLYTAGELQNVRMYAGAFFLSVLALGYASLKNIFFLVGGIGIVIVSLWNFLLSLHYLPLVYVLLNIIFAFVAYLALMDEKHGRTKR